MGTSVVQNSEKGVFILMTLEKNLKYLSENDNSDSSWRNFGIRLMECYDSRHHRFLFQKAAAIIHDLNSLFEKYGLEQIPPERSDSEFRSFINQMVGN